MKSSIRESKEIVDNIAVFRAHGVAKACSHVVIAVIYCDLLFEIFLISFDSGKDVLFGIVSCEDQEEFVSGDPRDKIYGACSERVGQILPSRGDLLKHVVARIVPHRVVDALEVVEVG